MVAVAFDNLPKAAFAGFSFPVSKMSVTGALRDHVHEYPHSPGGAPEKLGRKLYEFKMSCPFKQGMKKYPQLWPETLASLRIIFEGGNSFDLVVPTIGTITAYCIAWNEETDPAKCRTGVDVDLTFREDQSNLFLVQSLITTSAANYNGALAGYQQALANQRGRAAAASAVLTRPDSIMLKAIPFGDDALFDQILFAAEGLATALLTALEIGASVADLAFGLVNLCAVVDATATSLNDPTRYPLLYALHDVWQSAAKVAADAQNQQVRVVRYTVPMLMDVCAVSRAIYGDNTHAMDILATNPINDAFAIEAGTVLKAYVFTTSSGAAA